MTLMLKRFGFPQMFFNAGEASAAAGGGDGNAAPPPETVLFPDENKGGEGEGTQTPDPSASAGDWKEYVNDPAKSEADNAAAKAEHDKTKPADTNAADAANKVPEDGKYAPKMAEGVELDQGMLDALAPDFKEMGLTNAQVQKLTDRFTEIMQKRGEDHASSPEGAWSLAAHQYFSKNGTPDKWADTAKSDKDIGGDKWGGTVASATRFVNTMGTPALKEFMNASGAGNHPELIRVFAKAGELIREDSPPSGGASGAGKPADASAILFPNDVPKG